MKKILVIIAFLTIGSYSCKNIFDKNKNNINASKSKRDFSLDDKTDKTVYYEMDDDEQLILVKAVPLIELPSNTLENLGVDETYLQEVGFTKEESLSIIKNNFLNIGMIAEKKDEATLAKIKNLHIVFL